MHTRHAHTVTAPFISGSFISSTTGVRQHSSKEVPRRYGGQPFPGIRENDCLAFLLVTEEVTQYN